jgi:glycosyltransferase involved in cell wall biosynthesis
MSALALEQLRERFARVAIVHEWLTIPGGSEEVVLELLEMFPDAELFTTVYDPTPWPQAITSRRVHTSFLDRVPSAHTNYRWLVPLMNRAFRSFDLDDFDLVISSNHASAKNVRTRRGTLHVCYCHTPMRYAWDEGFLEGERIGPLVRPLLKPLLAWLRRQDRAGASGPDVFVANSQHVAERIRRYYGRDAEVVNPPVDVEHFLTLEHDPQEYYLALGRVVPYKRLDLSVAACIRTGRALKVAGDGRAIASISRQASGRPGIELLGRVSDTERDRLLRGARALLFPGEEDFGIVPVEAQAAGVPVIAYGVGGASETVLDERTGVLFAEQSESGLAAAIGRFEALAIDPSEVRRNAGRFGRERFVREMTSVIERAAQGLAKNSSTAVV